MTSTSKIEKRKADPADIEIEKKETTWVITLEEDPETGELIMPLPAELLESQDWKIGDTLVWNEDPETGSYTLSKSKNNEQDIKES